MMIQTVRRRNDDENLDKKKTKEKKRKKEFCVLAVLCVCGFLL